MSPYLWLHTVRETTLIHFQVNTVTISDDPIIIELIWRDATAARTATKTIPSHANLTYSTARVSVSVKSLCVCVCEVNTI